ncbi:36663546-acb3-4b92-8769-11ea2c2351be [Thermothielavioides terrestris]|nr:36663546-acb3-4b92-8769-11ea2c2351be [Thermothielavioides terrestris]
MPPSPARSPAPTGRRVMSTAPAPRAGPKDFSYLLRPEIYHPLTALNVPPAFRNPAQQSSPDTPIPDLLARGHFRAAAIAATQALTNGTVSPTDHARIFDLLYTRLACLTLIDATALAAQEVKALGDLHSAFYYSSSPSNQQPQADDDSADSPAHDRRAAADPSAPGRSPQPPQPPQHLVPWPLRLLAVRLQALGFGDPRRAVMSYYELAREARAQLGQARARHAHSDAEVWRARLADLGVRVAGALVEMDDLTGAIEHLGTLKPAAGDDGRMAAVRMALLWLHLGDVEAARGCIADKHGVVGSVEEKVVRALCDMADGEYDAALSGWTALREEVDDEMVAVNMAVCLLYVGRMHEGKALLETLVDSGRSSHTLLFNLTTLYELCTDRSRSLKLQLSERVAARGTRVDGWEKTNADFKLQ